jgi:hypothetical protein
MGSRVRKRAKYGRGSEAAYLAQAENRLVIQAKKGWNFGGGRGFNKMQKKSFLKVHDVYYSSQLYSSYSQVDDTGFPYPLNQLSPNNPPVISSRVGRKIQMHSLEFWIWNHLNLPNVNLSTDTIPLAESARISLVYDRQAFPFGSAVDPSAVFAGQMVDGSEGPSVFADINLDNQDRFLVLWDAKVELSGWNYNQASASPDSAVLNNVDPLMSKTLFQGYMKLHGLPAIYQDPNDAYPSSGVLLLFVNSSVQRVPLLGEVSPWVFDFGCRLRYYDF